MYRWSTRLKLRLLKQRVGATEPMTLLELEAYAKQIDFDLKVGQAMQNQAIDQLRLDLKDQPADSRLSIMIAVAAGALAGLEVISGLTGLSSEVQVAVLVAISAVSGFLGRHKKTLVKA